MNEIIFEWDEDKNRSILQKHNISFNEATTAFYDDWARIISDPDHSEHEERFILLGLSKSTNLLVVCHCYRRSDSIIRIISARRATRAEVKQYREFKK